MDRLKRILKALKGFWPVSILLWLTGLALCVLLLPLWIGKRDTIFVIMALWTALWLFAIVLRQYHRIRAERNIENLVELEVHREGAEQVGGGGDYRILRERLQHALSMQRAARSMDGGRASLYELPWYLVMGLSASGKTSLLSRSSLSAAMAGGAGSSALSGTRHCDWYFSRDAVLVDTAGRYLVDDEPAAEFADFLRTLRRQRRRPAVNGLILVVSLPELLEQSRTEDQVLAERLTTRIDEYRRCLGSHPPVYVFFSKADLLPGFLDTFAGLDVQERQTPWGMTFSLDEIRNRGVAGAFGRRFPALVANLRDRVDRRLAEEGEHGDSTLLRFPDYFAELGEVLQDFIARLDRRRHPDDAPLLRGLYFTSALQDGDPLPALLDDQVRETFALSGRGSGDPASADAAAGASADPASRVVAGGGQRSFFIADAFRQVIFPDRNLSLYQASRGWSPFLLVAAIVATVGVITLLAGSAWHNREWQQAIASDLDAAGDGRPLDVYQRGRVLAGWHDHLERVTRFDGAGVPVLWGAGLYQGPALESALKTSWSELMRRQALEPVVAHLRRRLIALNAFAERTGAVPAVDDGPRDGAGPTAAPGAAAALRGGAASMGDRAMERVRERATARPALGSMPTSVAEARSRVRSEASSRTTDGVRDAWWSARSDARNQLEQRLRNPGETLASIGGDAGGEGTGDGGASLSEEFLAKLDEGDVERLIEGYSVLKLYLILTAPQRHEDQGAFVAGVLPRLWRRVSPRTAPGVIDANSRLYADYLRAGKAPALARDTALVKRARASLNAFLIDNTLVDRAYLKYQLEVEDRYESLTLADMAPDMPGRLLYARHSVPAFYTRRVWREYLRPALAETVSGDLRQQSDWVLDDGDNDDEVRSKARFVRQLMRRYKRDYARAWERFLRNTHVADFATLEEASAGLARLGDLQKSPLRQVLEAVHRNTAWDAPDALGDREPDGEPEAGFWGRVAGVFDGAGERVSSGLDRASLPRLKDGALAAHFRPVARLLVAERASGSEESLLSRYLLDLRQLKVRVDTIRKARSPGSRSKALIAATLTGKTTEVSVLRNFVAAQVDTSRVALVSTLRPLFETPVENTWQALNGPARHQLNKAWDERIHTPWQQMVAGRYPVADSVNEASVRDVSHFIDPDSGLLATFRDEEIGDLAGGEDDGEAGLVDPRMIESIDRARELGRVVDSLSDLRNGFEVRMNPSPGLTDIILTIDGQTLHYRNNRQEWKRMVWPGEAKTPGARLDVVTRNGRRHTVFDYPNRWGLLRMIGSAHVSAVDRARQRLSWRTYAGAVSFQVRNFGGVSITDLQRIRSLSIPELAQ
ncbi:type VI secretion protein IcmF/TssM N-terminal domain-containing protein [Arhodomonas aquaeolei]|uniref:type VI secretion protein IcmF/TssM N-terminal domain-containing protein n=1 Tax=Arhodomonas aquaeolei TaxID=2369 RepID=UPI000375956E|nr:type VI secretion protein IcmF/TssM N-terminal domain-containing protein [Arhodomonas aquaeolei]